LSGSPGRRAPAWTPMMQYTARSWREATPARR
jgi:hypothetical protein